jgi:hypothetical protein
MDEGKPGRSRTVTSSPFGVSVILVALPLIALHLLSGFDDHSNILRHDSGFDKNDHKLRKTMR